MNTRFTVKYRRRIEGKTNYSNRIKLLSSRKNLLIFRKLSRTVVGSIAKFSPKGDIILSNANSKELEKYGWSLSKKNVPAAYLTGFLLAKKAGKKNVGELVADFGIIGPTKGSAKYSFLKGAVDGGLKIRHSAESFPDESRITGKHIEKFSKSPDAKNVSGIFEDAKKKIGEIS